MAPTSSSSSSAAATVTMGGKGSSLSSETIYSISRRPTTVQIDPSFLDKISSSTTSSSKIPQSPILPPENPNNKTLTLDSSASRAALAVLLNKLLSAFSSSSSEEAGENTSKRKSEKTLSVGPTLLNLVASAISLESGLQTLDFSSAAAFFSSLFKTLNDAEVNISNDELGIFESSTPASVAICAMLDCCASSLTQVADAVAAVSCEAARADDSVFKLQVSGDGFSVKDETDVAGCMRKLLLESKLVGSNDSVAFGDVSSIHASFRQAVRDLHSRVRVELNSSVAGGKISRAGNDGKEEALIRLAVALAFAVQSMCKSSLARARVCADMIVDIELKNKILDGWANFDMVKEKFNALMGGVSGSDCLLVLDGVYKHLLKLRDFLAWEAAVALMVIETDDSIEKSQVSDTVSGNANGQNAKGDNKSEKKKKKKKTLGKGTKVVVQLLRDRVMQANQTSDVNAALVAKWATELSFYFDPADSELELFREKVKEIAESNESKEIKLPKGTRDFGKEQMAIRERAFSIITGVFKKHGAVGLDTPVFELRETLMGKYGEDSKLIYDLADQGGELCSLRYDLTVPFARHLAMNGITALKRYQIAKVYRRDKPAKGRYREFYQCDFDIAGQYDPMEPDFEVIKVLTELLDKLNIGTYAVKLNHRKLLDGMLEICGVPLEKFRTVCSSIDKLDKQTFEEVKKELVEEKGVAIDTADKIGDLVKIRGSPLQVLLELRKDGSPFLENSGSIVALNELEILFQALEKTKALDSIVFDLSLARGLDYYTGVIYEAVFNGTVQVGSIAAGGRYDNLVGMFGSKQVPAVGVSLGIERVFAIMEQQERDKNQLIRATETEVLVAILGKELTLAAELVGELWDAEIKAEFKLHKKPLIHINYAEKSGIPWMVMVGESELSSGIVKLRDVKTKHDQEVPRGSFVEELQRRINNA